METQTIKLNISDKQLDTPQKVQSFIRLFGANQYRKAVKTWAEQRYHGKKDKFSGKAVGNMTQEEYEANREEIFKNESKLVPKDKHAFAEVSYTPLNSKEPFIGQNWDDIQEIYGDVAGGPHSVAMAMAGCGGLDLPGKGSYLQMLGKKPAPESVSADVLKMRDKINPHQRK